jgi:hypothetical protein
MTRALSSRTIATWPRRPGRAAGDPPGREPFRDDPESTTVHPRSTRRLQPELGRVRKADGADFPPVPFFWFYGRYQQSSNAGDR